MNFIKKIFQQRKAFLFNGEKVKEGDKVMFINSDGLKCEDSIKRNDDGKLFFWNNGFEIIDYQNAQKI